VTTTFAELFDRRATVHAGAPGRVNLMGDHTDYNTGLVLPAAIPQRTELEVAARDDRAVRLWSDQFSGEGPASYVLGEEARGRGWIDYVAGVTQQLARAGLERGFDARITSSVPLGSGLSSSASLEIATARALRELYSIELDDVAMARAAQRAEVEFVGAPVGIMDQMACSLADTSAALFIDTRTLAYAKVPLPAGTELLVINSGLRHSHSAGDYRIRRDECHRAARMLKVAALRDVDVKDLRTVESLPDPLSRRARHVVTENARVLAAVEALKAGDVTEVGRLFRASHASMRDDFEVSVPAVDSLVESTCGKDGVYGARLTGGGFGGAIVALTQSGTARAIGETVIAEHDRRFPHRATVVVPENEPRRTS